MRDLALAGCLIGLGFIALLPRVFFRPGRLNARWWLTASPFMVAGGAIAASIAGVIESPVSTQLRDALAWPALLAAAGGVALIRWTLHTHARPVSLWHQADDRPDELVTRGAYAHVRHPFYASFLLVLSACALALPHPITLLALLAGWIGLDRTAAREEKRLLAAFGDHYAAYIRRTGRFLPRALAATASGSRRALRPPIAIVALVLGSAGHAHAQDMDFRAAATHEEDFTADAPADEPSRPHSLRMPEPPLPQPSRQRDGLYDALITGATIGFGTGLVLVRDDAPVDAFIGAGFGGAAGAATAYATGFSNHREAGSLLGSVVGTAAGAGIGYLLANADVHDGVLLISSTAISAILGAGVSWLLDGI